MANLLDKNRRPLNSRQWPVFQKLARFLANRNISPNSVSLSSILFAVLAGLVFAATSWIDNEIGRRFAWAIGALLVQLRLCSNLLDGLIAVEGGKGSATGELYNEVPDRIADVAIMLGLGYSQLGEPMLGSLAAIVCVFVAYVRAIGASMGLGQVFLGPMAKPQRMALVTALAAFMAIAPSSITPWLLADMTVTDITLLVIIVGGCFTAIRRLIKIARLVNQQ